MWKIYLIYNGYHNKVWSPTNYTTLHGLWNTYVELPIGKTNIPLRKEFFTCSNKENCHINTPFNFRRYALTPCQPSNTKALRISQLWCNPQYLKNKKTISISDIGSTSANCVHTQKKANQSLIGNYVLRSKGSLSLSLVGYPCHVGKESTWYN